MCKEIKEAIHPVKDDMASFYRGQRSGIHEYKEI